MLTVDERRATDTWSIKKEISLGDLIAIAIAIMAILTAYARLDNRVTAVEVSTSVQTQAIQSTMAELRVEIRRMADSFDRYKEVNSSHKGK